MSNLKVKLSATSQDSGVLLAPPSKWTVDLKVTTDDSLEIGDVAEAFQAVVKTVAKR